MNEVQTKGDFNGLGVMVTLASLVLCSPFLYFVIELALGHAAMFSINGAK